MLMAIGSTRPLEDATRIAYRELVRWLAKDFKFDQWDIYMILSQVGKVRLGNFVDPKCGFYANHMCFDLFTWILGSPRKKH